MIFLGGRNGKFVLLEGNISEMYWVNYIVSYQWEERTQYLGRKKTYVGKNELTKLHRDVRGNTYLLKVSCDIYRPRYCYNCHRTILSYTNLFIS